MKQGLAGTGLPAVMFPGVSEGGRAAKEEVAAAFMAASGSESGWHHVGGWRPGGRSVYQCWDSGGL